MYGNAILTIECTLQYPAEYILMQCTGLKDKNGELIYEGDIVKADNTSFQVTFEVLNGGFICRHLHGTICSSNKYFDSLQNSEIIGNIYENPELLENN